MGDLCWSHTYSFMVYLKAANPVWHRRIRSLTSLWWRHFLCCCRLARRPNPISRAMVFGGFQDLHQKEPGSPASSLTWPTHNRTTSAPRMTFKLHHFLHHQSFPLHLLMFPWVRFEPVRCGGFRRCSRRFGETKSAAGFNRTLGEDLASKVTRE